MNILEKLYETVPEIYNPRYNPVINALLQAIAREDEAVQAQIQELKNSLFIPTASGSDLDILGNNRNVSRVPGLSLSDEDYRKLITALSLSPKQIKKAFYDIVQIFWDENFTNVNTLINGPFGLVAGDEIILKVDGKAPVSYTIQATDLASNPMTAEELCELFNTRFEGTTCTVTAMDQINIRTNTLGTTGSLQFCDSSAIGSSKLDVTTDKISILDLDQRVAFYSIDNNELVIELPAAMSLTGLTINSTLHFKEDVNDTSYLGNYLFEENSPTQPYALTAQVTTTTQNIVSNDVFDSISVSDTSGFDESGYLVFNYGQESEAQVPYLAILSPTLIKLDPSYVFQKKHDSGSTVNVIRNLQPTNPSELGADYAFHLISPSASRELVQDLLDQVKAAGIILKFEVLAPKYKYLIDNPFLEDDNAPSC